MQMSYLSLQLIHKHINIDHWNYPKPLRIISDPLFCLLKNRNFINSFGGFV